MTKDATGQAIERMADDEEVRTAVAAGDTAALEDLELSEEERAMLVAAADDFPEVEGFASFTDLKIPGGGITYPKVTLPSSFNKVATYAGITIKY